MMKSNEPRPQGAVPEVDVSVEAPNPLIMSGRNQPTPLPSTQKSKKPLTHERPCEKTCPSNPQPILQDHPRMKILDRRQPLVRSLQCLPGNQSDNLATLNSHPPRIRLIANRSNTHSH